MASSEDTLLKFCRFRSENLREEDGVLIGSDLTLEWALPWWWERYQEHNSHPVAFIDLGLSFEMKDWCKERGQLIPLRVVGFAEEAPLEVTKQWEKEAGKQFWDCRDAWFKKPLACLKSPFDRTLWIDVDCEIRGSLTPLFEYASKSVGFAMAFEQNPYSANYPLYNSGVIAFQKNHQLLHLWAEWSMNKNRLFRGDQEIFSYIVHEQKIKIDEIPPIYNWSRRNPDRSDAVIQHWHGNHGKFVIRTQLSQL